MQIGSASVEDHCFSAEGPTAATAWTEKRIDDVEAGKDKEVHDAV